MEVEGTHGPRPHSGVSDGPFQTNQRLVVAALVMGAASFTLGAVDLVLPKSGDGSPPSRGAAAAGQRLRTQDTLDTHAIIIRDSTGVARAILGTSGGMVRLTLCDGTQRPRISLFVDRAGTTLGLLVTDKAGGMSSSLGIAWDGSPALRFNGSRGEVAVLSQLGLIVRDTTSGGSATLAVGESGPLLSLADENGRERATLGCTSLVGTETGGTEQLAPSSLVLFDKKGKVIYRAP